MKITNKIIKENGKYRDVEFPEDLDAYLRSTDIIKSLDKKNLVIGCYLYNDAGDMWTTLKDYYIDNGFGGHTEKEIKKFMNAVVNYDDKYFSSNLKIDYDELDNSLKYLTECIICNRLNEDVELQANIDKYKKDGKVKFDSKDWLNKREKELLNLIEKQEKINRRFVDNKKEKVDEKER